jgi:hypothetical protein
MGVKAAAAIIGGLDVMRVNTILVAAENMPAGAGERYRPSEAPSQHHMEGRHVPTRPTSSGHDPIDKQITGIGISHGTKLSLVIPVVDIQDFIDIPAQNAEAEKSQVVLPFAGRSAKLSLRVVQVAANSLGPLVRNQLIGVYVKVLERRNSLSYRQVQEQGINAG